MLLAVDPDPNGGSWVLLEPEAEEFTIRDHGYRTPILELADLIHNRIPIGSRVVVENIQSYGMPVGVSVFETVKNIGELRALCRHHHEFDDTLARPKIKSALCHSAKATDANIRAAILDLYPPDGGGKTPQVGTKSAPGPLYGISKDVWAALAVGLVWLAERGDGPLAARDR